MLLKLIYIGCGRRIRPLFARRKRLHLDSRQQKTTWHYCFVAMPAVTSKYSQCECIVTGEGIWTRIPNVTPDYKCYMWLRQQPKVRCSARRAEACKLAKWFLEACTILQGKRKGGGAVQRHPLVAGDIILLYYRAIFPHAGGLFLGINSGTTIASL